MRTNSFLYVKNIDLALVATTLYDKVQSSACTPTSTQSKVIMINLTLGKSYETYFIPLPVLFHCAPSLISLSFHSFLASNFIAYPALFHSCLAFNFIAYPALFHFHFIPAWLLISLPTQPYFIAISFLPTPPNDEHVRKTWGKNPDHHNLAAVRHVDGTFSQQSLLANDSVSPG